LPTQAPARKPYRRSSIRQQPRIYRGPAIDQLTSEEANMRNKQVTNVTFS